MSQHLLRQDFLNRNKVYYSLFSYLLFFYLFFLINYFFNFFSYLILFLIFSLFFLFFFSCKTGTQDSPERSFKTGNEAKFKTGNDGNDDSRLERSQER